MATPIVYKSQGYHELFLYYKNPRIAPRVLDPDYRQSHLEHIQGFGNILSEAGSVKRYGCCKVRWQVSNLMVQF